MIKILTKGQEMNKYVMIHLELFNDIADDFIHNNRLKTVNHLRNNQFHNNFENFYGQDYLSLLDIKAYNKKYIKEILFKKFNNKKKKLPFKIYLRGVIALSPEINIMLSENKITITKLNYLFKKSLKNFLSNLSIILNKENIGCIDYSIHYDEKTPHLHFTLGNYNTPDLKSTFGKIRSFGFSKVQDIVSEPFAEIGFTRGEKKSAAKHKNLREMHEAEIRELCNKKAVLTLEVIDLKNEIEINQLTVQKFLDQENLIQNLILRNQEIESRLGIYEVNENNEQLGTTFNR